MLASGCCADRSDGLKRLEYRGYDSAGLAVIKADNGVAVRRNAGKLENTDRKLRE